MYAAALRAELRIPNAQSLKDKRRCLRQLDQNIRRAFPAVAVSEVDFQDQWQRTAIGVAAVAPSAGHVERLLVSVQRRLDDMADFELLGVAVTHMERP